MQIQHGRPPVSSPLAGVDERQAWVRQVLGRRANDPTPAELERVCKTLKRLQPAAAAALAETDLADKGTEAKQRARDPDLFLQTLRGLTP